MKRKNFHSDDSCSAGARKRRKDETKQINTYAKKSKSWIVKVTKVCVSQEPKIPALLAEMHAAFEALMPYCDLKQQWRLNRLENRGNSLVELY